MIIGDLIYYFTPTINFILNEKNHREKLSFHLRSFPHMCWFYIYVHNTTHKKRLDSIEKKRTETKSQIAFRIYSSHYQKYRRMNLENKNTCNKSDLEYTSRKCEMGDYVDQLIIALNFDGKKCVGIKKKGMMIIQYTFINSNGCKDNRKCGKIDITMITVRAVQCITPHRIKWKQLKWKTMNNLNVTAAIMNEREDD